MFILKCLDWNNFRNSMYADNGDLLLSPTRRLTTAIYGSLNIIARRCKCKRISDILPITVVWSESEFTLNLSQDLQVLCSSWDGRPFGHNRSGLGEGSCAPFLVGELQGPNLAGCQSTCHMTNSSHVLSWLCDELTERFWRDNPHNYCFGCTTCDSLLSYIQ